MYIGILDDDNRYIEILKEKLDVFGDNVYKTYHNISNDILNEDFDIFFLDVMLADIRSFGFGEQLSLNKPTTTLVYVSSIDNFVYESIYQTSFFFIRKSNIDKDLDKFFTKYYKKLDDKNKTIEFISQGEKHSILQRDIICITTRRNSVAIMTYEQEYIVYTSLKKIYDLFDKNIFCKLNSFIILNFESVQSTTSKYIIMKNNEKVYFSKKSKSLFIEAYASYRKKKLWN